MLSGPGKEARNINVGPGLSHPTPFSLRISQLLGRRGPAGKDGSEN